MYNDIRRRQNRSRKKLITLFVTKKMNTGNCDQNRYRKKLYVLKTKTEKKLFRF